MKFKNLIKEIYIKILTEYYIFKVDIYIKYINLKKIKK